MTRTMKKLYSMNGIFSGALIVASLCPVPAAWAQRPSEAELKTLSSALPLIQQQNWSAAETTLQEGMASFPHSALLSNALGIVYEREHRQPDAIRAFEQAVEWLPNFTAAQLHLASLHAERGECDRANSLFLAAAANTADEGALSEAGLGLAECKNFAGAAQVLEKARSASPSPAIIFNLALVLYKTSEFDAALSMLETLPHGPEQERAEVLYLRGKLLKALQKPGSAASLAQACRQHAQEDYCKDAAVEMIATEQLTEAVTLLESANKGLSAPSVSLLCALGLAQFRLGRYQASIRSYSSALNIDPQLDAAREGLGFLLYITGELEQARSIVEQGPPRPTVDFYLPYLRALVLYRTSAALWPEALSALAQSLRSNANFAASYFLRGKIALEQGNETRALADFQNAAKLDPTYPLPYYKMSQIYLRQGRREEAEQARKRFAALGNQREDELLAKQAQALLLTHASH